jgi:HAD superfamily hydrolase (TIGR01509 family)
MPPALIAFDLMDTVVRDPFFSEVVGRIGGSLDALDSSAWADFELGRIDEATYLERMLHPGRPCPLEPRAIRDLILSSYRYLDGIEPLLDELRATGRVELWAFSNYPVWLERARAVLGLDRHFAGYAASYQIGARKPDRAAFLALAARTGVALERSLLVDDREPNLAAASALGMPAFRFLGAGQLRRELNALGLL